MQGRQALADGAVLLGGLAGLLASRLLDEIAAVAGQAPFRQMRTPGDRPLSAWMTNCGSAGWVTDRRGYRYEARDPLTTQAWPPMPAVFCELAWQAAAMAGFGAFEPDACLINRYQQGARMGLHQDRDEAELCWPIVSVSLGLPVTFLFGGLRRSDPVRRIQLEHGDVVVWGGPARLACHGVAPLKAGSHPLAGPLRYNLTLRRALPASG